MDKLDKIQQLHRLFKSHRRPIAIKKIAEHLQCSERTAKRTIYDLRDRFFAPIEHDSQHGWHYDSSQPEHPYELPGLWLTSQEIEGFSVILNLLQSLQADEFSQNLKPIEQSLNALLQKNGVDPAVFTQHIKILHRGDTTPNYKALVNATEAINSQQQLHIRYKDYQGNATQRSVTPLTLVHYCDNWYLEAWCHKRTDFRSFVLSRIIQTNVLKQPAKPINNQEKNAYFDAAYGIFSGAAEHTAEIIFFEDAAHEAAAKHWHSQQSLTWEDNHTLCLHIPYSDDRELLRDILKYGNHAEVRKPESLREKIAQTIQNMHKRYSVNTT